MRLTAFKNISAIWLFVDRTCPDLASLEMRAQLVRGKTIGLVGFGRIAKGANFRSLGDIWANTTTPDGTLMLIVLGDLAEFAVLDRRAAGEPQMAIAQSYNVSSSTIARVRAPGPNKPYG